jgi:signal transduction histidine kinase
VPPLFWLDVTALIISAVIAAALMLMAVGAGLGRSINRFFVIFALAVVAWTAFSMVARWSLWLDTGDPLTSIEMATWASALAGPLFVMFVARYLDRFTKWIAWAAGVGLAATATLPLFRRQTILNIGLDANGTAIVSYGVLGWGAVLLSVVYLAWSLILLWQSRRRVRGPFLAVSALLLLIGFSAGGAVAVHFPAMSVATALGMGFLASGLITQQVFNPLRDQIAELERRLEDRTWELDEAYKEVKKAYVEVEGWVDERIVELQQEIAERKRVEAERAELLHTLQHRSTQLQTAAEVSKSASMILDPKALIDQTVRLIQERFDFYYVGLFLLDESNEYAVLQAGTGEAFDKMLEVGHRLKVNGHSMIGWCTSHREARIALDVGEEAIRFVNPFLPKTCSEMALPLISRGRCIGALSVQSAEPNAFPEEDIAVLQTMADQVAIAIENVRLLEAERRRSAELEALRQASLHVTSSLELQPVLEAIIEHALRLVSADNTHIFLYDNGELVFGAAMWAGGLQREPYAVPRPQGLTYTVAHSGEQVVIPDVDVHPMFGDRRWGGAVAGFPLRVGDDVCGVMNIAFEQPHVFSESELNVLELLADQAAIAIHNAHMHQRVLGHADDLADALAQQEELDRLKREFMQNVSHELRLPLALIRGYAEMLDSGELGELHEEHRHPISVISRRSRMLGDLVEDITLILGAETRPAEWRPIALDDVARTAVAEFAIKAKEAGVTLRSDIADVRPVSGSLMYLRRVLDNLLNNAVKFTPNGGTITVRLWQEDTHVKLEVKDTGIGIPADQLERIFERFYQVDGSIRRRYGGVGLGLALVKELVELHDGQVRVESQVDKGSAFIVTLPVSREEEWIGQES